MPERARPSWPALQATALIALRRPAGEFARVGHRGASALAPENTLRSLELAVELGCDMLEFDVLDLVDGMLERSWVSGFDAASLRRVAELEPELPRSYTLPRDRFGISKRGPLAPVVRGALGSIGASLPRRLPALLARARAVAATLHYSIASRAAIDSAHELDAAVYVWTVDDPRLAERLVRDGADGIITNDPRIFTMFTA